MPQPERFDVLHRLDAHIHGRQDHFPRRNARHHSQRSRLGRSHAGLLCRLAHIEALELDY
jgi:hypothetical protein